MCKIIFIGNYKGGVGKTTTTINLAQYFSDSQKKILTIDLDPQSSLSEIQVNNFQSGKRMSLVDIKTKLTEIYQKINYEKSPKATDIIDFFDVKECIIVQNLGGGNKKRLRGYDLLTSHEQEMRDKLKAIKN